jgi:NAD(P)-dependent dehydrogenase (short-subunit alcohol dehydrogenase family)/rhamnose utilization protein RhaD (predicted bifunctional aldolase and dehydrogenase)
MDQHLSDLINISRYFGQKKDYVIAGGGNTSYKDPDSIWIKASGTSMKDITSAGFAVLSRELLKAIYTRKYSDDSHVREAEVKADLQRACTGNTTVRPSVETSLHELIRYSFVVHTHPTLVNAITCANDAEINLKALFGDSMMYLPYTDPGYVLFTRVRDSLNAWRQNHDADPKLIFLQNHGVFVSAGSTREIKKIYQSLESAISERISEWPEQDELAVPGQIVDLLPALRMIFSMETIKVARIRNNKLVQHFTSSGERFREVSLPFTPDQIVYCKARSVYLESDTTAALIDECKEKVSAFAAANGYMPRIAGIRGFGIAAFEDNIRSVETLLDIFEDWMQISYLSRNFGGPRFMSERDVAFIDNWEVENYRRQVARAGVGQGKVNNKVVIVTGGARGFGEGISKSMMNEGANVVIADLNMDKGTELAAELNKHIGRNAAVFQQTDVTQTESVEKLIFNTVSQFGGIDVLISNAGVLRAGGLDELSMESFEFITRVNYTGYFVCAKYASAIMKLQASCKEGYFTDIIQINSKSGLKGSNRNFAYSGSKFGSIGLTQSFALELMPWRIKVNAICPGNFFEGPLWSDPETGLFRQYLKTGKVPGAKTVDDVKAHYEKQVPAGRGCRVEDVMKAIYYVIDQEYETGQAVPVTGGQEMLG